MTILVTGVAGFIGFHACQRFLEKGEKVIGIDNLNPYYDVTLKQARLAKLKEHENFIFYQISIENQKAMEQLASSHPDIDYVVHLAAQAGVRYSLTQPYAYGQANLMGHLTILEFCRNLPKCKHLVYASSSSVYGSNKKLPFSVKDRTDSPISLYAATKKSCELMSHSYSHLFEIPITGLRFFTVYGPWGRPDMSAFIFTKAILSGTEMPVFNFGKMRRNFTFINDIVDGTIACLEKPPMPDENGVKHKVYNIGNNRSEELMDFIKTLEELLGKKANIKFEPLQAGDVVETIADISDSTKDFGFTPKTNMKKGLKTFINWYRKYYNG